MHGDALFTIVPFIWLLFYIAPVVFIVWFLLKLLRLQKEKKDIMQTIALELQRMNSGR
ncbi:hypothetical protein [Peribacillus sp. SCS-37]|uniref:hypothetical protein n=1 Tax=Paraperibacillus esterisolvens TaxID=3115296 RepID=UPI003905C2C9